MLTTEASTKIAPIHHRMPVILDKTTYELWMDPSKSFAECLRAFHKSDVLIHSSDLEIVEVSSFVNSVKN